MRHHVYQDVGLEDILRTLATRLIHRDPLKLGIVPATEGCVHRRRPSTIAVPASAARSAMTVRYLFDRLASSLPERAVVIADTGQCLFSAAEVGLACAGLPPAAASTF